MTGKLLDFAQVTDEYVFIPSKHFIQVSVKEYLWKCMHAKIVPFKYIKVCKELFALISFGSIVTFALKH